MANLGRVVWPMVVGGVSGAIRSGVDSYELKNQGKKTSSFVTNLPGIYDVGSFVLVALGSMGNFIPRNYEDELLDSTSTLASRYAVNRIVNGMLHVQETVQAPPSRYAGAGYYTPKQSITSSATFGQPLSPDVIANLQHTQAQMG